SIAVLALIDARMAGVLAIIVLVLGAAIARFAAGSRHLHDEFAGRAASVTGDLADIVGNIGLVRAFGAAKGERQRLARGIEHEMPDAPDARPLISLGGAVTFVNVGFNYPGGGRVLQDFDLHIRAGERVGLAGRSGAGKSTVLSLVQRLYDPDRGHVLIDEQDI